MRIYTIATCYEDGRIFSELPLDQHPSNVLQMVIDHPERIECNGFETATDLAAQCRIILSLREQGAPI